MHRKTELIWPQGGKGLAGTSRHVLGKPSWVGCGTRSGPERSGSVVGTARPSSQPLCGLGMGHRCFLHPEITPTQGLVLPSSLEQNHEAESPTWSSLSGILGAQTTARPHTWSVIPPQLQASAKRQPKVFRTRSKATPQTAVLREGTVWPGATLDNAARDLQRRPLHERSPRPCSTH